MSDLHSVVSPTTSLIAQGSPSASAADQLLSRHARRIPTPELTAARNVALVSGMRRRGCGELGQISKAEPRFDGGDPLDRGFETIFAELLVLDFLERLG